MNTRTHRTKAMKINMRRITDIGAAAILWLSVASAHAQADSAQDRGWWILSDMAPSSGTFAVTTPVAGPDETRTYEFKSVTEEDFGERIYAGQVQARCNDMTYALRYGEEQTPSGEAIPGRTTNSKQARAPYQATEQGSVIRKVLKFVCATPAERLAHREWITPIDNLSTKEFVDMVREGTAAQKAADAQEMAKRSQP